MGTQSNTELLEAVRLLTAALQQQSHQYSGGPAQILLALVPLTGIIFGAVILFFFLYWHYKIKKELIRTNQYRSTTGKNFRSFTLLLGCLSAFVGLPMTILFSAINGLSYVLLGGLIPLFAGIGLLIFYSMTRKRLEDQ